MILPRTLYPYIKKNIKKQEIKNPVLILYGPRQVGKTTLVKQLVQEYSPQEAAYYSCDYADVRSQFSYENASQLEKVIQGLKLIVLDEAQRIQNIGLVLKILIDDHPNVQVIATGSSSFELSNQINEPLTGRKKIFQVYPMSFLELYESLNFIEQQRKLPILLRFGSYPEIVEKNENETIERLRELTHSYLFKDIFNFQQLKKPELLYKLLQLLAFQIGSEVSFHELAVKLGVDQTVIQKYIHLLEEAFVIFRLSAFKRNLRNEVTKSRKIYFWDLGIRNAIINNFNNLDLRNDIGALWENFCILERLKHLHNHQQQVNSYFWRTYEQKEIDYIEEVNGELNAYEFKWSTNHQPLLPAEFMNTYKPKQFKTISKENFKELLD